MPTNDPVLSLRLDPEDDERLDRCATKLDLSKNIIARHALRAALDAIEAAGYRVVIPLEMAVAQPAVSKVPTTKAKRGTKEEPHPLAAIASAVIKDAPVKEPIPVIYSNETPADRNHPPSDAAGAKPTRARRALRSMMKKEKDAPK